MSAPRRLAAAAGILTVGVLAFWAVHRPQPQPDDGLRMDPRWQQIQADKERLAEAAREIEEFSRCLDSGAALCMHGGVE